MKQILLFSVVVTIITPFSFARPSMSVDRAISKKNYNDSTLVKIPGAPELFLEIIKVTGLQPNFELREAKVLNIEASVSHRKRYILYNPFFITQVNNITKDKWAALALLAHEIGHHLNGHTIRKSGSKPQLELEADEFAGFILYKLGASLQQAQEVMKYIAKTEQSGTHPARSSRMIAIEKGWNTAAIERTVMVKN